MESNAANATATARLGGNADFGSLRRVFQKTPEPRRGPVGDHPCSPRRNIGSPERPMRGVGGRGVGVDAPVEATPFPAVVFGPDHVWRCSQPARFVAPDNGVVVAQPLAQCPIDFLVPGHTSLYAAVLARPARTFARKPICGAILRIPPNIAPRIPLRGKVGAILVASPPRATPGPGPFRPGRPFAPANAPSSRLGADSRAGGAATEEDAAGSGSGCSRRVPAG